MPGFGEAVRDLRDCQAHSVVSFNPKDAAIVCAAASAAAVPAVSAELLPTSATILSVS